MHIALLAPDQHESALDLLAELHAHYHRGARPARDVLQQHLREGLLGDGSPLQLVVAADAQARVLGLAAILFVHSLVEPAPPHDRQCHLKELFVRASARGRGVGRALMAWVARDALRRGCGRMDWNVQVSNPGGIHFYARLGAHHVEDRLSFRLDRAAMQALATAGVGPDPAQASDAVAPPDDVALRRADAADALCLSVLATQVFLDTYALAGIRPAIAREVVASCSEASFAQAITSADTVVWVAERAGHLVGFAHLTLGAAHPLAPAGVQAELLRLYVQERWGGRGVGSTLLAQAERTAAHAGAAVLWLTAWVHNHRARHFYARRGYQDHGQTWFTFEGESHENRVFARSLPGL